MIKRSLLGLVAAACIIPSMSAQQQQPNPQPANPSGPVNVRGQILLPGGETPNEPIRFALYSGDGRVNEIRYTDSNGRFILERLNANIDYTIDVTGDNALFGSTTYSFNPGYNGAVRVTLNAPARKVMKLGTLSAASAYKPNAEAVDLHEAALKDIEKEDFDAAEAKLRKAVARDPKFLQAHIDLGAILISDKKYEEAEAVLRQAIVADPKSHVALLNLGTVLNRERKFPEAVSALKEALRLEPGLVAGHLQLGIALVETDQLQDAEKELLVAVRKPGEEEVPGFLYLGKLYAMTGAFPKGVEALEKYLAKAPSAPNAADVRSLIDRMKAEMAKQKS
jgi:tetratricopeptide (TPR) repeat protein